MIGWEDVSNVVVGMVPLYVALLLGYASVRWWRLFTLDQCDGINRFICLFIFPLFSFDFTSGVDPLVMNYRMVAADAVSKAITIAGIALWWAWANLVSASGPRPSGSLNSCVTGFSLSTLTNLLFIGVPIVRPMYGEPGVDIVVQLSVVQSLVWFPLLLLFLEFRKTRMEILQVASSEGAGSDLASDRTVERVIEGNGNVDIENGGRSQSSSRWGFIRGTGIKLAMNPNIIAVVLGIAWALAAHW